MKFKINYRTTLNEAISPTTPNWLKPAIINSFVTGKTAGNYRGGTKSTLAYNDASSNWHNAYDGDWNKLSKKISDYKNKGIDLKSYTATGYRFYGNNLNWWNKTLASVLKNSDINFANAEFIVTDPPKKGTDEKLKDLDHYQPFILIEKDGKQQIYAPGLNDKELCIVSDDYKTFKYVSYNQLKPYIKGFCYIDLTKPESTKSSIRSKKYSNVSDEERRYKVDIDSAKSRNYPRGVGIPGYGPSYDVIKKPLDKSGYITNPDKYKEILRKNKINNYPALIQDVFDKLTEYKGLMSDYLKQIPITDKRANENTGSVLNTYRNAIYDYNNLLEKIETINNYPEEEKKELLLQLFDPDGYDYYASCLNNIKNLGFLNAYRHMYLDW